MLEQRWTYANSRGLTKWYGHVDYYGEYVLGEWFALDAESGTEYWTRRFSRPTNICACTQDVIVASEERSDGPWSASLGIYGIDVKTGQMLWASHGRGLWGKLLYYLDYIPGFTNDFRDSPERIANGVVLTSRGRYLDVHTGQDISSGQLDVPETTNSLQPDRELYENKVLKLDEFTIEIETTPEEFSIHGLDRTGTDAWRFSPNDLSLHLEGNFYSYRFYEDSIYLILGDAPKHVPIKRSDPLYVKQNPANYQLGVLNVATGDFEVFPLNDAQQRSDCRIETIRDQRLLVSCDGTQLTEYRIVK